MYLTNIFFTFFNCCNITNIQECVYSRSAINFNDLIFKQIHALYHCPSNLFYALINLSIQLESETVNHLYITIVNVNRMYIFGLKLVILLSNNGIHITKYDLYYARGDSMGRIHHACYSAS